MKKTLLFSALIIFSFSAYSQSNNDSIFKNFQTPPNAAKPRVWWHWMNGNITQDGIRKDLNWMHRVGIGGFQNFDAALMTPKIVEKRLTYMTPEWKDAFHFATQLADSLKLEMAIASSPGWSQSGGPWVPAKDGMKKLVWRETRITGGQTFNGALPKPYTTTGTFQNIPLSGSAFESTGHENTPEYYEDIAVIAYRLTAADVLPSELNAKITSSGGNFTLAQLTDGDLAATNLLPSDTIKGYAWIQYEFPQPQTIKSLTVVGGGAREQWGALPPPNTRSLEASDDGINFHKLTFVPLSGALQQTIDITPTTAKYFRVTFQNPVLSQMAAMAAMFGMNIKPPTGTDIAEIVLHPVTRINHAEEKAGFAATYDLENYPTPSSSDAVAETDVIDITTKMNADGTLNWTPPSGNWKIMRFGYSLTGKKNHPASPEATGLEVDKMDARALKDYFENYLNQYKNATGGLMGSKGLQYMVTDSYEAEQETWTPKIAEEFKKRRGYSLIPWMPVLTGQIIKSTEASEQFLWDWRKTISELIAENYYDQLTDILAAYGMKRYTESHENGRLYLVDGMDVKRKAAVPMSATWYFTGSAGSTYEMAQADIRESASVAHIYGQNLVAAESLTALGFGTSGAWSYDPQKLKPVADLELASGLNRFVIHTSPHQPVDDKIPGLGLGPFGQWFTRHETWAEQAKVWTDYLARSSYMLQQGKYVADVVYYYGEDNNITGLFGHTLPGVPEGYSYDFINADALINLLSVKDGRLVTPSGMSYRVLMLDSNAVKMSLPVLKKINQLAKAGATIAGVKPMLTPSLSDNANEFNKLVSETWPSSNTKVSEGKSLVDVLNVMNVTPDFTYTKPTSDTKLMYVHRKLNDRDIYWIDNRNNRVEDLNATFRIEGKIPELWFAETGKTEPLAYSISSGVTKVKLHMEPNDAFFVVFKNKAVKTSVELPEVKVNELATIDGVWNISFQPNRGAPATATFDKLASYTDNADARIKYFSGTASYTKTINTPADWFKKDEELWLNLGDVKNLAEVIVNGKSLGIVWKKPFRINVTNALKPGENKLEIKVTNLWVNRLIGDAQPNVTNKITYTTMPFYRANSPLLPSGLLGPVKIVSVNRK